MPAKLNQSADKLNSGESTGLRVLKVLVVVMGVLIVAGVITIVVTIVQRMSDKSEQKQSVAVPVAGGFDTRSVALPVGARVVSVSADGGRLFIHVEAADGRASVLVLDGASGTTIGTLDFEAGR